MYVSNSKNHFTRSIAMAIDVKKFSVQSEDKEKKVVSFQYDEKDVFKDHLKTAEISEAAYSKVKAAEKSYAEEVAQATTDLALSYLKKHKDTEAVSTKMPFGIRGSLTTKVVRADEHRNVRTGETVIAPSLRMKVKETIVSGKHMASLKEKLTSELAK